MKHSRFGALFISILLCNLATSQNVANQNSANSAEQGDSQKPLERETSWFEQLQEFARDAYQYVESNLQSWWNHLSESDDDAEPESGSEAKEPVAPESESETVVKESVAPESAKLESPRKEEVDAINELYEEVNKLKAQIKAQSAE